jgi:hypothetical protein
MSTMALVILSLFALWSRCSAHHYGTGMSNRAEPPRSPVHM